MTQAGCASVEATDRMISDQDLEIVDRFEMIGFEERRLGMGEAHQIFSGCKC